MAGIRRRSCATLTKIVFVPEAIYVRYTDHAFWLQPKHETCRRYRQVELEIVIKSKEANILS